MMKRIDNRWIALGLLWVAYFLLQGTRQIYGATLPQIRADFGVDDLRMGAVASVFFFAYAAVVPHGVRAVCVSPGPVLTRPSMSTMATVRGVAAQPDELVNVILYLCGDDASFVTGANILVDGGHMCVPADSV